MIPFQSNANVFPWWKWNWFPAWIKDDPNILLFFKLYILMPELWPSFASLSEFILASCLSITFLFFRYCFPFFFLNLFLYLISLINESKLLRHVYICVKVMTLPFWMLAFKSSYSSPARTQISQSLSFIKWKLLSCVQLFVTPWTNSLLGSSVHGILLARKLEWVATSFSRGSSQLRDQIQVSRLAGGFFTIWATREAQEYWSG